MGDYRATTMDAVMVGVRGCSDAGRSMQPCHPITHEYPRVGPRGSSGFEAKASDAARRSSDRGNAADSAGAPGATWPDARDAGLSARRRERGGVEQPAESEPPRPTLIPNPNLNTNNPNLCTNLANKSWFTIWRGFGLRTSSANANPCPRCSRRRCGRIPADQVFFREEKARVSLMICSVCRLFDACKTVWMTEHFEPEDEKDVERRLRELLESML